MNHITEEQIEWIYTRYDGDMINCANAVARQAVVSYVDQQAKELPVLPGPEYRLSPDSEPSLYDPYDMQAYGAACAAHAREMALSEAARVAADTVCDTHIPTGVKIYGSRAGKAIEALKGK